jgi:uncharacterized protein (DUF2225 family)
MKEEIKFKIGDEFELEVYAEECCELCDDIIHNHIDCPVCKNKYAKTNQFRSLYDETELTCCHCGTKFEKISDDWYSECRVKIISLK